MGASKPGSDRPNTLHLSQRELDDLADLLDAPDGTPPAPDRVHTRFKYRRALVMLELTHPGGNVVRLPVVSRNISSRGIGLLHSSFIHPGSVCTLCIHQSNGSWTRIDGRVVRCTHRSGKIHEIGVEFDEEVDTRIVLGLDPMSEAWTRERVDPKRLGGRVLMIDDDDLMHRLAEGLLKETEVELSRADSIDDAIARARDADLILCDYHLEECNGVELFERMRAQRVVPPPVLLFSADLSLEIRESMREAGAVGFLSKPLNKSKLFRALAEFLPAHGDSEEPSALTADHPGAELVGPFVAELPRMADELTAALESDDGDRLRGACRLLAGQGPSLGFDELGAAAQEALQRLETAEAAAEAAREITHLVNACRETKPRSAA